MRWQLQKERYAEMAASQVRILKRHLPPRHSQTQGACGDGIKKVRDLEKNKTISCGKVSELMCGGKSEDIVGFARSSEALLFVIRNMDKWGFH